MKQNLKNKTRMLLLYTTCASQEQASALATNLLEKRLAACINMWPIASCYLWDGELQSNNEYALLVKSCPKIKDRLEHELREMHPYDVPCILFFSAETTDTFATFVRTASGCL